MEAQERKHLIDRYRDGARAVREAVASLSAADLDRRVSSEWSAREVVHHIAEADLIGGVRLRRILAGESPAMPWVDEGGRVRRARSDRAVETSVGVFTAVIAANATLLESLGETQWQRAGRHSLYGPYSVEDWLCEMSGHAQIHAGQVLRAAGRGDV